MKAPSPPLLLTVHPARTRPGATALLVLVLAVMASLLGPWVLGPVLAPPAAVGVTFAGLLLSLARWFLPTTWLLDDQGLHTTFLGSTQTYPWARFRSWRRERGGLYLSPLSDPSRFDRFRGLFVFLDDAPGTSGPSPLATRFAACVEARIG